MTVTNSGDRPGSDIVQLYIRDLFGSFTRPVKELKAFRKTTLAPGASEKVTFSLTTDDLAFYGPSGEWMAEPGAFHVFVGSNSADVQRAGFDLQ